MNLVDKLIVHKFTRSLPRPLQRRGENGLFCSKFKVQTSKFKVLQLSVLPSFGGVGGGFPSRFPLNSNHGIEPAAALTYRAFLLIAFLPFVLLPMISVSLTIGTLVPTALEMVCHTPARSHSTWFNFNYPSFFTHNLVSLFVLITPSFHTT